MISRRSFLCSAAAVAATGLATPAGRPAIHLTDYVQLGRHRTIDVLYGFKIIRPETAAVVIRKVDGAFPPGTGYSPPGDV